jgi:hypothetical protein
MRLKISDNLNEITRWFDESEKDRQKQITKDLQKFVSDSVTIMTRNPTKGLDVEGVTFQKSDSADQKSYSAEYAKARAKRGYQTNPVNLTITGGMLKALTFSVKQLKNLTIAEIFFTKTATTPPRGFGKKAAFAEDKARGVEDHGYKFFGLSKRRINELFNLFR